MKGIGRSVLLASALLAASTPARAQIQGQYVGAPTLPVGTHLFGAYVEVSEDALGLLGQLRLSFFPDVDFGFQGGLTRIEVGGEDFTTLRVGGDLRFQVAKAVPADVSVGGALGIANGDDISILTVGPTLVASRTFSMGSSSAIIPYVGVAVLFSNADVFEVESTDFSLPFRVGAEVQLAPEIRLVGEVQLRTGDELNDDVAFATGVNLPF